MLLKGTSIHKDNRKDLHSIFCQSYKNVRWCIKELLNNFYIIFITSYFRVITCMDVWDGSFSMRIIQATLPLGPRMKISAHTVHQQEQVLFWNTLPSEVCFFCIPKIVNVFISYPFTHIRSTRNTNKWSAHCKNVHPFQYIIHMYMYFNTVESYKYLEQIKFS